MIYKRDLTAMDVILLDYDISVTLSEALVLLRAVQDELPNTGQEEQFITLLGTLNEGEAVDLNNFRTFINQDCIDYIEQFPFTGLVVPARDNLSIDTVATLNGIFLTQSEIVALATASRQEVHDIDAIHTEYERYACRHPDNEFNNLKMFIDPNWWGTQAS